MQAAPLPPLEEARLEALASYDILDSAFEREYDELAQLASAICQTPVALISLVDRQRQWFKARVGTNLTETPRDIAFCAHAILGSQLFEVRDALLDDRFTDNPLVTGAERVRYYAGVPLLSPEGQALGTLCAIDHQPRQLTDQQRAALEILGRQVVTQMELRRKSRELSLQAERLTKLNEDKDRFFSIIGHDLRSPFSAMLGLLDMLVERGSGMEAKDLFRTIGLIRNTAKNTFHLTENLLQWASVENGKMAFHPQRLPMTFLFQQVVEELSEVASQKQIRLAVQCPAELTLTGDQNMLSAALRNLCTNAIKFSKAGSQVTLSARQNDDQVILEVQDQGLGFHPKTLVEFQAKGRTRSSHGTAGELGTGLGLSLVQLFVQRHHGHLEIHSEPGQGATLRLVFPVQ